MDHRLLHGDPVQPRHSAQRSQLCVQQRRCGNTSQTATNQCPTASTASSRHSGGVNLLFADGSIRFIKSSVATGWSALGSKNGGEVISSDAY